MKFSIIIFLLLMFSCQAQKKDTVRTEKQLDNIVSQQNNIQCNQDVCLQLRNHDISNKSFEIYILNSVPVAGFQCDFTGINIIGSDGGLLKQNEYQTSNSATRILSFSMQAKPISVGEGVLTTIYYSNLINEICMTEIIFAGNGGDKLTNNIPNCLK